MKNKTTITMMGRGLYEFLPKLIAIMTSFQSLKFILQSLRHHGRIPGM